LALRRAAASGRAAPDEPLTLYLTILDGEGRLVERIPYQDDAGTPFGGNMCVRRARVSGGKTDDIVLVTHQSSTIFIFSRANQSAVED